MFEINSSERQIKSELDFDIEKRIEANIAAGMTEKDARLAARREFGSVALALEECRDERRGRFFENLLQDVRFGIRTLLKKPGFCAVAILTLALGIGANTAIFSVVNAVLLRPLPFPDSSKLVLLYEGLPEVGFPKIEFSAPDVTLYARVQHSFTAMAPYQNKRFEVSGAGEPERVTGARAGWNLFDVLGVQPILGRVFHADEDQPGQTVVIISYGLWHRKFGDDANVVGRTIDLDRKPYTVVGVLPRGFRFPLPGAPGSSEPAEIWVPMAFSQAELQGWGMMFNNDVAARLAPGVTIAQARSEAEAAATRILGAYPPALFQAFHASPKLNVIVAPLQNEIVGTVRPLLLVLQGAVGVVLLIACTNVALLLLAGASGRTREIAIRAALGAGRGRLISQLLTESFVLAAVGAAAGLAIAVWSKGLLLSFLPAGITLPSDVPMDGGVLVFTFATAFGAAIAFGLIPAFEATRARVHNLLQEGARGGSASQSRHRLQNSFVVAEFALALILTIGAGLLLKTFTILLKTDPGFQPQRVVALTVPLPAQAYPRAAQILSLYEQALAQTSALPGVVAAGVSNDVPLHANETDAIEVEQGANGKTRSPAVRRSWILGDYLQTMGIPLLRGRGITPEDRRSTQPVGVVSESFVKAVWPNGDAIGKRLRPGSPNNPWVTIVGIVGDVPDSESLAARRMPHIYTPLLQESDASVEDPVTNELRTLDLVVRAQGSPETVSSEVVAELHKLDPAIAIGAIRLMSHELDLSVGPQRFNAVLVGIYAGVALLLALVGIYGVLAYMVTQQTHDIGVRIALGARRTDIFALVLRRGLALAAIGSIAGLAGASAVTRLMAALLYGVQPRDPIIFAGVTVLLTGTSVAACLIPARRAMQVDPMVALRHE